MQVKMMARQGKGVREIARDLGVSRSTVRGRGCAVHRADAARLSLLTRCDFSFEVDAELAGPFDGMRHVPIDPPYRKTYGFDARELSGYLDRPDAEVFVAEVNGGPAGYVAVSESWNRFAVIEDIAVDASHRGRGIARRIIRTAFTIDLFVPKPSFPLM